MNLLKIQIGPFEARGSMVYTEDKGPGTAQLVCECRSVDEAKLFARSTELLEALINLHDAAEDARNLLAGARPPITREQAIEALTIREAEARKAFDGLEGVNVS